MLLQSKIQNLKLIVEKHQRNPNQRKFCKVIGFTLPKHQDHESKRKTEELFLDERKGKKHDN